MLEFSLGLLEKRWSVKKKHIDKTTVRFTGPTAVIVYQHFLQNCHYCTSDALLEVFKSLSFQKRIMTSCSHLGTSGYSCSPGSRAPTDHSTFLAPGGLFLRCCYFWISFFRALSGTTKAGGKGAMRFTTASNSQGLFSVCFPLLETMAIKHNSTHRPCFPPSHITRSNHPKPLAHKPPITYTPKIKEKETGLRKPATLTLALPSQWSGCEWKIRSQPVEIYIVSKDLPAK